MFGEGVYLADDGAKADQYTRAADTSIQAGGSPLAALHPVQKDQSCGLAEPVQRTGPEQCAIVL